MITPKMEADTAAVEALRTRSYTPAQLAIPLQAGKATRKLFADFNTKLTQFSNIGARLGESAKAFFDAKEAYGVAPTDANLTALASAKNADDILRATGVRNDPDFFENLRHEQFATAELFRALADDCSALAAKFAKASATAREIFADALHAKIMAGEDSVFLYAASDVGRATVVASARMNTLETRRDYIAEQSAGATGLATGHPHLHSNLGTILEALKTPEPADYVAAAL